MNLLMNRIHVTIAKLNSTHLKNKKQSDLHEHLLVHLWVLLATWLLVAVFSFFLCSSISDITGFKFAELCQTDTTLMSRIIVMRAGS